MAGKFETAPFKLLYTSKTEQQSFPSSYSDVHIINAENIELKFVWQVNICVECKAIFSKVVWKKFERHGWSVCIN